jgi:hypothetical protein
VEKSDQKSKLKNCKSGKITIATGSPLSFKPMYLRAEIMKFDVASLLKNPSLPEITSSLCIFGQ